MKNSDLQNRLQRYRTVGKGLKMTQKNKAKVLGIGSAALLGALPNVSLATVQVHNVPLANQVIDDAIYNFDIDGNGGVEFKIRDFFSSNYNLFSSSTTSNFSINLQDKATGISFKSSAGKIARLANGATIQNPMGNANSFTNSGNGPWANQSGVAYAGFKFEINGNPHFGWIELDIVSGSGNKVTVTRWAYEDVSGVAIQAGSTVSLPVELLSFKAIAKNSSIRLDWATASEENNAGFDIQRSTDGKVFETIAFVEGKGTTLEQQEYFYDDKSLRQEQTYYYRLKQIDYDGQFEFSEIITATIEKQNVTVGDFYPNPTSGAVQLNYTSNTDAELTVTVYNTTGQTLANEIHNVVAGENNLAFNFSALPKGNYFVKLQAGENTQYQKLVIN